jgi:hypothetical protein
MGLAPTPSW